jgi:thioesterase domain-containing protein
VNVAGFLSELRRLDIHVWVEGGQLRCNARAGTMTEELRQQLRQRRNDIVTFLRSAHAAAGQQSAIVPLQPNGERMPVFAVPGHNGDVFCYRAFSQALGADGPFFGLQLPGSDGQGEPYSNVEKIAAYLAQQVRAFRPQGACIVAGFCAGGAVAFELAQQLLSGGTSVAFLALFGSPYPDFFGPLQQFRYRMAHRAEGWHGHARALAGKQWRGRIGYLNAVLRQRASRTGAAADPVLAQRAKVERATLAAVRTYTPRFLACRVQHFMPSESWANSGCGGPRWSTVAHRADVFFGPDGCTADNMLLAQHAPVFAELFRHGCQQALGTAYGR